MAAILYMQIINQDNPSEGPSWTCELAHGGHAEYMQISWFSNSTRIIHQRVFRKKFAKIEWLLATGERLRRYWICKLAYRGRVEYAN